MNGKYSLTKSEEEIMELLWEKDRKMSSKEILDYFNEHCDKDWKKYGRTPGLLTGSQKTENICMCPLSQEWNISRKERSSLSGIPTAAHS